jgi:hypothetical protein
LPPLKPLAYLDDRHPLLLLVDIPQQLIAFQAFHRRR